MNFVEIVRGIGNVGFVMLIAGAVAYVGDRVGHQVGRKRLSLFGIRPRYTSTIIAIGTGMVIALAVTLIAIFASEQVKTAFFKLNQINEEIAQLTTREHSLETKVNTGRLVEPVDVLMVPFYRIIDRSAGAKARLGTIRTFYFDSVKFINQYYTRLGLRPYAIPTDVDKKLNEFDSKVADGQQLGDVMLTAVSDQNLFENDQLHFGIRATIDRKIYAKGGTIAQLTIPGNSGANANIALGQLQNYVALDARRKGVPPFLADNVQAVQLIPDARQIQERISKPGSYLLTAYAAEDFYPHTARIPILIVLTQEPGV
jgi:hypothetical protein